MFTQIIIRKRKTDRQTDGCITDGLTDTRDVQCETIIPRHYCVAGYKNLEYCQHLPKYFITNDFMEKYTKKKKKKETHLKDRKSDQVNKYYNTFGNRFC